MKKTMLSLAAAAVCGVALAKLPPPPPLDDAGKAKAAEAAARTAWQAKLDAFKLCQAQDRAVANARRVSAGVKTVAMVPGQPAAAAPAPAAAAAATPARPAATGGAPAATAPVATAPVGSTVPAPAVASGAPAAKPNAAEGGGTPTTAGTQVAALPGVSPCSDPGPFAYAPPEQKPLETSGAHSPAATATSPPSVRAESATMAPAKPNTAKP